MLQFMEVESRMKQYVGRSLKESETLAVQNEDIIRVMTQDDENFVGTCEYVFNRVNLNIQKGIVVEAWQG